MWDDALSKVTIRPASAFVSRHIYPTRFVDVNHVMPAQGKCALSLGIDNE